jgi:hypothetical protein
MAGYIKIFQSILDSTIWRAPDHVRLVWITMLAMSNKHGEVDASIPGLADRARVSIPQCEEALEMLGSPDPYSRSTEYEGRRIENIEGGWRLLNHAKYRDMLGKDDQREANRIRQAKFQEKRRQLGLDNKITVAITKSNGPLTTDNENHGIQISDPDPNTKEEEGDVDGPAEAAPQPTQRPQLTTRQQAMLDAIMAPEVEVRVIGVGKIRMSETIRDPVGLAMKLGDEQAFPNMEPGEIRRAAAFTLEKPYKNITRFLIAWFTRGEGWALRGGRGRQAQQPENRQYPSLSGMDKQGEKP